MSKRLNNIKFKVIRNSFGQYEILVTYKVKILHFFKITRNEMLLDSTGNVITINSEEYANKLADNLKFKNQTIFINSGRYRINVIGKYCKNIKY